MTYDKKTVKGFADAAQSLKLYRRAELVDQKDRPLIEQLYVDPLPNNATLETILRSNTTFLVGRKGTGKSTIFQRAQHEIRKQKRSVSAYVDIKTVFESASVDPALLAKAAGENAALSQDAIRQLLLFKSFMRSVLSEIKAELRKQIEHSFLNKLRDKMGRGPVQIFERLDELIDTSLSVQVTDITALQHHGQKEKQNAKASGATKLSSSGKVSASESAVSAELTASFNVENASSAEQESENSYSPCLCAR